jgi:hypothetical protein
MVKKLLAMAVVLAMVGQGIARADEPATPAVSVVHDRAALPVHIDAFEEGDRVAVATDEGIVSGEVVGKDDDDLVIDQPLIQGGAERLTIPRRQIQAVRYQQSTAPQTHIGVRGLVIVGVVVGALVVLAK